MIIKEKGFRERLIENLPPDKYPMLKLHLLTENDKSLSTGELKTQIINYHQIIIQDNQVKDFSLLTNEKETRNQDTMITPRAYEHLCDDAFFTEYKGKVCHPKEDFWRNLICRFCKRRGPHKINFMII